VFSPVRGEYVDLVAQAPLPSTELAFDIGVGSGALGRAGAARRAQDRRHRHGSARPGLRPREPARPGPAGRSSCSRPTCSRRDAHR
jgi:hypothetical protein